MRFGELLDIRLSKRVFTTEDSVRYTFFAALLEQQSLKPEDVVLEYPHPAIEGAEVDTWLPSIDTGGVALEFKYDRGAPSGKNSARTQKAGKIFHDLSRLGKIEELPHCIFIYLASREMQKHFVSERNNLHEFFGLPTGQSMNVDDIFMQGKPYTFLISSGGTPNVVITTLFAQNLAQDHALRAYAVRPLLRHL